MPNSSPTYEAFSRACLEHVAANPDSRLNLGLPGPHATLPDPSHAARLGRVQGSESLLATAEALLAGSLSDDQRMDVRIACVGLRSELVVDNYDLNTGTHASQCPEAGEVLGGGLFLLFINDPRPSQDRLADILGRVRGVPAFLDAMIERLDTPLARWVDMDVEKVAGLPSLFSTLLNWAAETDWAEHAQLAQAFDAAQHALTAYTAALRALPTTTSLHVGPEVARQIVRARGIELGFDELHTIAIDFLQTNRDTLEALRGRLVQRHGLPSHTTVPELQQWLHKTYAVPIGERLEDLLDRYQEERARILEFIAQRDLFPVFAEQDMKILRTPAFMEPSIPAGAMMSPPPFREGVRTSLVYLTLSRELLDEHTELSIPGMMIHEGIPGHHLHLAHASRHPSALRRLFGFNDQAEGWTTMLEDYMLDQGYCAEVADEVRFCTKLDIARIGARVAIDLFFMTGERRYLDVGVPCDTTDPDPFKAAGNLLQAITGFTPGRVEAELNWYSQERGYPLSYLAGNHLMWRIKGAVDAAAPSGSDPMQRDRDFHRLFLGAGNMPMRLFAEVVQAAGMAS